jgi:hypothetical protein
MNDRTTQQEQAPLEQLIELVDQALDICDQHGFIFAGIHICQAMEILKAQKNKEASLPPFSADAINPAPPS